MNTHSRTLGLLEAIAAKLTPPLGRESLPKSSETKQAILQTTEEIARRLGVLEPLPAIEEMATVTYSIGTSGRDYSTVTAWEADLDNGALYSPGDDAVGEMHNDSAFDETIDINGGGTIGLTSRTLTVAVADRHDGTAGSGVRFVYTSGGDVLLDGVASFDTLLEWIEFDFNGQDMRRCVRDNQKVQRCIFHDAAGNRGNPVQALTKATGDAFWTNNIVYDMLNVGNGGSAGLYENASSADVQIYNNTVHNITCTGTGNGRGIDTRDQSNENIRNNICTSCDVGFDRSSPSNATMDYNATDDTSAAGANSLNSIVVANQYVSTVGGSEDLHLKTGADAIDEGVDLGTTPTGVEVDINGRDRDANADTWDIGAHEFVGGGGPTPSTDTPFQRIYR